MLKACRLILLITLGATAQDQEAGPVPTWPRDGRVRPDDSRQYVFLTGDRHTMVVIVPKSSESERSGPEQIVKVPLMNDLAPAVSVSILTDVSGGLIYRYTVSNGRTATDAIGEWNIIGPPQDADLVVSSPVIGGEPVWAGAPAFAAIARQPILPQGPLGRYLGWFHQDDHVILPGQKTTGFVLRSRYRPGLTAAWFSSGKLLELDQSWPEEVFRQLEPVVNDRLWTQRFVITIGPMFPPSTPAGEVIESFQSGVDRLLKTGWLNLSSPFVAEVVKALYDLGGPSPPAQAPALRERPSTEIEKDIAIALDLSLGIGSPECVDKRH